MQESVADRIGKFVHRLTYESLPLEVVEKAKTCMLNGIGIGVASHRIVSAQIARETVKAEELGIDKDRAATIFCDGSKVSVMGAAFSNATLFHGRAQEDILGSSHVGTVATPAALAIAEREGITGKELIASIVAAYEVVGAFDREISVYTTPRGFRATPIFGIYGSASAASKLLGLSEQETINAIGFAAAFASGTLECCAAGTTEWRYEVGVASRDGIMASLIARNGGRAAPSAIDGKSGFLNAFANTVEKAEEIVANLGRRWEIVNVGFKPYPVCAFNQTPVTAALDLVGQHRIEPDQIEEVMIRVNPYEYDYPGINYRGPFATVESALLSTPFCLAVACADKEMTLDGVNEFTNPKVLGLMAKIKHIADEAIPRVSCFLSIKTKEGKTVDRPMMISPSHYNFGMERVAELVRRVTAEAGVDQRKVDQLIKFVKEVEYSDNIKDLVEVLASCP